MTIFLKNEGFRVEHVQSPSGDVILAYGCYHNDQDRYFMIAKSFEDVIRSGKFSLLCHQYVG